MRRIHIEKKRRGDARSLEVLRKAVRKEPGARWSTTKIAARTGLPLDEASWAMMELAGQWPSRLYPKDDGTLEVTYTPTRGSDGWRGWLRRNEGALRKLGSTATTTMLAPMALMVSLQWVLLVASIPPGLLQSAIGLLIMLPVGVTFCLAAIVMVFETLLFVGLAMLIAAVAFPVGIIWTGAWDDWWVIPLALIMFGGVGAVVTVMGWNLVSNLFMERGELEATWGTIVEIVVGPQQPSVGALEDEERILAWIQDRQGIVTVWELAALLGATPEEASRDITHLLVDYGGDIVVTDEGAVVFAFKWLRTADALPKDPAPPQSWLNLCEPPVLLRAGHVWGLFVCLSGAIAGVIAHPDIVVWPDFADIQHAFSVTGESENATPPYGIFSQWLGLWPYAALAAVIVARSPITLWKRVRYNARKTIATLAQAIVEGQGQALEEKTLPSKQLLAHFEADIALETQALHFPKAKLELSEANVLRQKAHIPQESKL